MTFGFYVKATLQMQVPTKSKFKLSLSNTAMHQHSNRATKTNAIFSTIFTKY